MIRFADLKEDSAQTRLEPPSASSQDPAKEKGANFVAAHWYRRACQFVNHACHQVSNGATLGVSEGERLIAEIVHAQLKEKLPDELVIQSLYQEQSDSFLVNHMVNVSVYAIMVGGTLGLPQQQLSELGLSALFHDIGKILVPQEILYKKTSLSQQELAVLLQYPHESYNILNRLGAEYHHLADTAFQVHERFDGSGYPQGLKGKEIRPYAQIIGLVDIYEAITHDRPHRQKFSHFLGMKELIQSHKRAFHRDLFKALLQTFSLFPLNSYVKLNSGAIGKVVQTYGDQLLRPKVEIVVDAQKRLVLAPRTIDLKEQAILHVVDAVAEEELPG